MTEKLDTRNELADFLETVPYPEPYVILGVGAPCGGRTEALTQMADRLNILLVGPDEIRKRLVVNAINPYGRSREIWDEVHDLVRRTVVNEYNPVIIDGTHVVARREGFFERRNTIPTRSDLVKQYRSYGARAVMAVVCHVPLEEALERNQQREAGPFPESMLESMIGQLDETPVSIDEGFDIVASRISPEDPIVIEQVAGA